MADYTRAQLIQMTRDVANRYGIREELAIAQIQQESNFNPNARSYANAQGIAQFIPATAARFGLANPFDPVAALDAYGRYMRYLLDLFGGREDLALAGYNSGENRGEYRGAAAQGRPINWNVLPGDIPTQTRNYVNKILSAAGSVTEYVTDSVTEAAQEAAQSVMTSVEDAAGAGADIVSTPGFQISAAVAAAIGVVLYLLLFSESE